ncbi:MAG: xanthine dehydrogenase family protein subunit M [Thermodesulfobacteriota bacterium]
MTNSDFFAARDIHEACTRLSQSGKEAHILAGGTDLMVAINRRRLFPHKLIYIGQSGMDAIEVKDGHLVIGAAATHTAVIQSKAVKDHAGLLVDACCSIGSKAIRNIGTIGGNICNASPAADAATALLALGAEVKLVSAHGERAIALKDFFTGPGETVLQPDELLKEIILPLTKGDSRWGWLKVGQRKADVIGIATAAVSLRLEHGTCRDVRIALGAVAPTPLFAAKASAMLEGRTADESLISEVAQAAADETSPIDDARGSAWYRKQICGVLVKRILTAATK